jgi:hypothetical protein
VTHQACNVSVIQGCGGDRQGHGGCGGGGQGGPNARALAFIPQEENDKVTVVKNKYHPASVYNKFNPAKKAKHFQLRKPRKPLGLDTLAERPKRAQQLLLIALMIAINTG